MPRFLPNAPRRVRLLVLAAGGLALVQLVALGALQLFQLGTEGVLTGVTVAGRDVQGLGRDELRRVVADVGAEHGSEPVVITAGGNEVAASRRAVGSRLDEEGTVEAAWDRGRRGLWRALFDHVAARAGRREDVARFEVDEDEVARWARRAARELSTSSRPPRVGFVVRDAPNDVEVEVTEAREGTAVDPELLAERLREALAEPGAVALEARVEPVPPDVAERDVDRVLGRARRAVSAPVVLENPTRGDDLRLSPEELASVLAVEPEPSRPAGERLRLRLDPGDLADELGDRLDAMEVAPTEASFAIVDREVRIRGGRAGFEVSLENAADRILELVGDEAPRTGDLPGDRTEPRFSREDARALNIEESVSSFTTEYSCCKPRVQNIHLIADLVDGALIRPGERFEVNDHVGPRTRARGFVAAPAIVGGEFVDAVGGGVSQFATTFFNAAFFAGIELDEFKPHSYYFERYPMGNEATLSYGSIDLAVINDSPHGILVNTAYSDTSVTVEFWSTEWADVHLHRTGPTNVREGERRNGFDVTVRRVIDYPDGTRETEEYFHRYRPQD